MAFPPRWLGLWALAAALAAPGCEAVGSLKARRIAREGNSLYRAADYRSAITRYREAIALDPDTPNVHLNLGYALFSIYDPSSTRPEERDAARDAVTSFEEHLRRSPKDDKARAFRIKMLLRAVAHDTALADKAQALFVEMLEQRPDDAEVKGYLVSLFIDAKRYPAAVEYFTQRMRGGPQDLDTMKLLAVIADKNGAPDEAIGWYRKRAEKAVGASAKAPLYYELATYAWNVLRYQPDKARDTAGLLMADLGIEAAKRAMGLQKDYAEAMVYANLLYLERGNREPGEQGKYFDQNLAYALRVEASKILAARKAAVPGATATATVATATAARAPAP